MYQKALETESNFPVYKHKIDENSDKAGVESIIIPADEILPEDAADAVSFIH